MPLNTPLSGAAHARTLYFLHHRREWPHWPFLPLVRRPSDGEQVLGVLFDCIEAGGPAGFSCTVFATNMFLLPQRLEQFLALPREVYDTAEELVAAGWSVD